MVSQGKGGSRRGGLARMPSLGYRLQAAWALHPPTHLPDPSRSRAHGHPLGSTSPPDCSLLCPPTPCPQPLWWSLLPLAETPHLHAPGGSRRVGPA